MPYQDWDLPTVAERLARLEAMMVELDADVRAVERELGGVTPNGPRQSVRKRLHDLEGIRAAESAARSALSAAKAERAAIASSHERRYWAGTALGITILNVMLGYILR